MRVPVNIEEHRITEGPYRSNETYGCNGAFDIPYCDYTIKVIISDGLGWDHASVSLPHRVPTWEEMCYIKQLFWGRGETVIQYHPAEEHYVNYHPHVLHLWRQQGKEIELPPSIMVGPKRVEIWIQ